MGFDMIKRWILLIICIPLNGCLFQTIYIFDINKSELFCLNQGGVLSITENVFNTTWVECMSGDTENLKNIKLDSSYFNRHSK